MVLLNFQKTYNPTALAVMACTLSFCFITDRNAGIAITHGSIFRFFAPQRRRGFTDYRQIWTCQISRKSGNIWRADAESHATNSLDSRGP